MNLWNVYNRIVNVGPHRRRYHFTEINGLSWAYRKILNLSVLQELNFYSDHGRDYAMQFDEHEINHNSDTHVMWWKKRADYYQKLFPTRSSIVLHRSNPLAQLIHDRDECIDQLIKPKKFGLIYFFPHANEQIAYRTDIKKNLTRIRDLHTDMGPVVACLHYVDINNGLGNLLTEHGIPWISNGHNENYNFGKKMISNFSGFEYAYSEFPGTELFYCHLLGVKYFTDGNRGVFRSEKDHGSKRNFDTKNEIEVYNRETKLFSFDKLDSMADQKMLFVREFMGLDAGRLKKEDLARVE